MKLEEIDNNEYLWDYIRVNHSSSCKNLENSLMFAFQTTDGDVDCDEIELEFWRKYGNADQIIVEEIDVDEDVSEFGYRYFGVNVIIYKSGITL